TGNGRTDLAVAGTGTDSFGNYVGEVSVLLGNGHGAFQPVANYAVGTFLADVAPGDFTGNGRTDLAVTNQSDNTVSVLLGNGNGAFVSPSRLAIAARGTPVVADVNGDGTNDVLVINSAGNILYRQGIPGRPGTFEPPVAVNPRKASRDIAWVPNSSQGPVIAS